MLSRHPVCVSRALPSLARGSGLPATFVGRQQSRGHSNRDSHYHACADLHFMACPSGMTAIAPATAIVLVDRDFRFHVATGAECRLHGMSLRRSLTLAIRAMGNWSPRRARLSTSPGRSATRLAEDSSSLSPRVACGFSLSISHASGAWSSEMKPRGGSSRHAGGAGHMTKVPHWQRRHFCS